MKYIIHGKNFSYLIENDEELEEFTKRSAAGGCLYVILILFGGLLFILGMFYTFYLVLKYPVEIIDFIWRTLLHIINFFGPPVDMP